MLSENQNPKISIIIPVYNVASHIEVCLKSVINQTYQNTEILTIDDCGKDNSMSIVENIIKHNHNANIKVIHHIQNMGLSNARNTGIKESNGDYLYFLDSDDFITCDCIESFVQILEKFSDLDIIIGSSVFYPNQWAKYCIDVKSTQIPLHSNDKIMINNLFLLKRYYPLQPQTN